MVRFLKGARRAYKKSGLKKTYRKVRNLAKNRYGSKGGRSNIAKDVMMLKTLMNVEKKRIDIIQQGTLVGQLNANAAGYVTTDITPIPVEGNGYSQRSGSSIKIVSAVVKFQFWQQTNNTHRTKFRIEFWKVRGVPITPATLVTDLYNVTPAPNIIDYNAPRDPDYFGTATRLFSKTYTNSPQFSNEIAITDITIPLRLQHHIRYNDDTTNISDGQIVMMIFCDSGNLGLVSTNGFAPVLQTLSGLIYNMDIKWYYVDN